MNMAISHVKSQLRFNPILVAVAIGLMYSALINEAWAEICNTPLECYAQAIEKLQQREDENNRLLSDTAKLKDEISRLNDELTNMSKKFKAMDEKINNEAQISADSQGRNAARLMRLENEVFK
jgi:peptidoglycan hydrolase CwlO-like protein